MNIQLELRIERQRAEQATIVADKAQLKRQLLQLAATVQRMREEKERESRRQARRMHLQYMAKQQR